LEADAGAGLAAGLAAWLPACFPSILSLAGAAPRDWVASRAGVKRRNAGHPTKAEK